MTLKTKNKHFINNLAKTVIISNFIFFQNSLFSIFLILQFIEMRRYPMITAPTMALLLPLGIE
jgi:hypothetical protein